MNFNLPQRLSLSPFKQRLSFEMRRLKRLGFEHLVKKIFSKSASLLLWLLLLPLTLVLHIAGYRRVTVFTDRIGHLALEPACLIKEQALGLIKRRKWILLALPNRVANDHLLRYWEPYFAIVRHPLSCFIIDSMSTWGLMRYDISHYILAQGKAQAAYRIFSEWGDRPPVLTLSDEDERWGAEKLQAMGLPKEAWFVCVHVREGGFSPVDEEIHAHRNGSIENTIPAIQEIIRRGGWVIRIGDPTMRRVPDMPQVIDYAHHPLKSPRMDIVICAKAKFILGNSSGISLVGTAFGVPCAVANMIPASALGIGIYDVNMHKLLWSKELGRFLTFSEAMASPAANFVYASQYANVGIVPQENSAADINKLVVKIFELLAITDDKQKRAPCELLSLFSPHHYGYGSISHIITAAPENK